MEIYEEAHRAVKSRTAEWDSIKTSQLLTLNDQLKQANERPISLGED